MKKFIMAVAVLAFVGGATISTANTTMSTDNIVAFENGEKEKDKDKKKKKKKKKAKTTAEGTSGCSKASSCCSKAKKPS